MNRITAGALVALPVVLIPSPLHFGHAGPGADPRARVDETIGVGDVVLGAPPPPGFRATRKRGPMTVWTGHARWDAPPQPELDASVSTYHGQVGRVTVTTQDPLVARALRADLEARLGRPMKVREKAGGEGARWFGKRVFVSYDARTGVPGGRVRITDISLAKLEVGDLALDAEVLTRE